MPVRKLCRALGLYVLGLCPPTKKWGSWEQLYGAWQAAGDALEAILRAYLRTQTDLPPRLREVLEVKAEGRQSTVLRVDLTSQGDWHDRAERTNDQQTGLPTASAAGRGPRQPLDILVAAFGAGLPELTAESGDAPTAWSVLARQGAADPAAVLTDELRRVLELCRLDNQPDAGAGSVSSPTRLRRAMSHDPLVARSSFHGTSVAGLDSLSEESPRSTAAAASGLALPASPLGAHFPNKSVVNLSAPAVEEPSWADFASAGFGSSTSLSEFGLTVPKDEPRLASLGASGGGGKLNGAGQGPARATVSEVKAVEWFEVEEELADAWLDTLAEQGARGAWPPFVLAELAPGAAPPAERVLVVEQLVPFPAMERSTSNGSAVGGTTRLARTASITESTMSRKWSRRASSIFGASKSRPASPLASPNLSPVKPRLRPRGSAASGLGGGGIGVGAGIVEEGEGGGGGGGLVRTLSRTLNRKRSGSLGRVRSPPTSPTKAAAPPVPKMSLDLATLPASPTKAKTFHEALREGSSGSPVGRRLGEGFGAPIGVNGSAEGVSAVAVDRAQDEYDFGGEGDRSLVDMDVLRAAGAGSADGVAALLAALKAEQEERESLKSPPATPLIPHLAEPVEPTHITREPAPAAAVEHATPAQEAAAPMTEADEEPDREMPTFAVTAPSTRNSVDGAAGRRKSTDTFATVKPVGKGVVGEDELVNEAAEAGNEMVPTAGAEGEAEPLANIALAMAATEPPVRPEPEAARADEEEKLTEVARPATPITFGSFANGKAGPAGEVQPASAPATPAQPVAKPALVQLTPPNRPVPELEAEPESTALGRSDSSTSLETASSPAATPTKKKLMGMSFLRRGSKDKGGAGGAGTAAESKKSPSQAEKDRLAKARVMAEKEDLENKELRKIELQKREEEVRAAPAPVSSVRKRVLELEAENRRAEEKRVAGLALGASVGAGTGAVAGVAAGGGRASPAGSRPGTPTPGGRLNTTPPTAETRELGEAAEALELPVRVEASTRDAAVAETTPTPAAVEAFPGVHAKEEAAAASPAAEDEAASAAERGVISDTAAVPPNLNHAEQEPTTPAHVEEPVAHTAATSKPADELYSAPAMEHVDPASEPAKPAHASLPAPVAAPSLSGLGPTTLPPPHEDSEEGPRPDSIVSFTSAAETGTQAGTSVAGSFRTAAGGESDAEEVGEGEREK